MVNLQGKKILILGATEHSRHIIDVAKKWGIYTIVTDYVKGSPAKAYADKAYDISTLDVDALISLCREEKIDGVLPGYVDINLVPYYKVCQALHLPFYLNEDQFNETMNKNNFKKNCRKFGLHAARDIDTDTYLHHAEEISYPIIIKPADSYSSKGITVCEKPEDLPKALDIAMQFSTCKEIVVEEFIVGDDVYLYFTVQDGVLSLSAMADRLLNNDQPGFAPQPVGYFFPSKYIDIYYEKVHDKLQKMVDHLGLKNCSFFMQGFAVEDNIIFFEMGLRLSGGCGYLQIRHQNEIDQVEMHIQYAITGKFGSKKLTEYDNARFAKPACVVVVLLNDGEIKEINGLDQIENDPSCFHILQLRHKGDVLSAKGTLNQVFARIYLCNNTVEELDKSIKNIKKSLTIIDTDGNNMIMNLFDESKVY